MTNFQKLVEQFARSEALKGTGPWLFRNSAWLPEWQDFNTEYRKTRVGECIGKMPKEYQSAYGQKLRSGMDQLKAKLREEYDRERLAGFDQSFSATKAADWASIMVDAVLNWDGQSIEGPLGHRVGEKEFKRFAVVVCDIYDRFRVAYEKVREVRQDLEAKSDPPPLVTFSPTRLWGPHTINADKMSELIKARVGVVSLPAVFAKLPLLWVPLAHEVFGHDVPHALVQRPAADGHANAPEPVRLIPGMIEDLREIVAGNVSEEWRPTWRIWTEELAADLAGLLCMGPYFAIGFAAFMSATGCSDPFGAPWKPGLVGTTLVARGGRAYDEHPPDLLRLHVLLGAARAMFGPGSVSELESVVTAADPPSRTIDVYDFDSQSVLMRYDCRNLTLGAQEVGKSVVNKRLKSLGNQPVTHFYSWNDEDEHKAREVETLDKALLQRLDIKSSHLLAGATMAAYANPAAFREINEFLNAALFKRAKDDRVAYKFQGAR